MAHAPLVVTDESDSCARSSEEIERTPEDKDLDQFQYVHWIGLPHRSTQIEITNDEKKFFVWERRDGRLEIPGGHVDWLRAQDRAEEYEEAARREVVEELLLHEIWECTELDAIKRLEGMPILVEKVINQVPSSHVNNNEWVTVYRLEWPSQWPDPVAYLRDLAKKGKRRKVEAKAESARWLSEDEIKEKSLEHPMAINAAMRLFWRRRGLMIRLFLREYFLQYPGYCFSLGKGFAQPDRNTATTPST